MIHSAGHGAAFPVARLVGRRTARPVWEDEGSAYRPWRRCYHAGTPGVPTLRVGVATDIAHHRSFMDSFMRTLWWVVLGRRCTPGCWAGLWPAGAGAAAGDGPPGRRGKAQRLDHRLPADTVPAELAELADSLNDMLARLENPSGACRISRPDLAHELRTLVSNLMTQAPRWC